MTLSRRSFIGGASALLSLPGLLPSKGDDSVLACFREDTLPVDCDPYCVPYEGTPSVWAKYPEVRGCVSGVRQRDGQIPVCWVRWRRAFANLIEATDQELEEVGKTMLLGMAALNPPTSDPERWMEDHDLALASVLRVRGKLIAVTEAEFLGAMPSFRQGPSSGWRGLVLFNTNGVVEVSSS